MDLFLDANVFLSFYHYGKDDIETMHKAVKLIQDGEIRLLSNEQLRNEIYRNRHSKIFDSMKSVRSTKFGVQLPNYFQDHPRYNELLGHLKSANQVYQEILTQIDDDIDKGHLAADRLIAEVLEASTPLDQNEILSRARERVELRNPPGKNGSLGDAIHWECLLASDALHVHIVSQDGDFGTPLRPGMLNPFLKSEWLSRKPAFARARLHETLSAFLKENFANFELSIEAEKDELIANLMTAGSFKRTHELVAEIFQRLPLTAAQSRKLCHCLVANDQIHQIAHDADIQELFRNVKDKAWQLTEAGIMEECDRYLGWSQGEMSIPF